MKTLSRCDHRIAVLAVMALLAGGCGGEETSCFVAGTSIATPRGQRAIETLSVGDIVLAFDHQRRSIVHRRVTATFRHGGRDYRWLSLGDRRLGVTDDHPIYDRAQASYRPARELDASAQLLALSDGVQLAGALQLGAVTSSTTRSATVYNIEVGGTHNYFAEGILVHNKSINRCYKNPGAIIDVGDPCQTCICNDTGGFECKPSGQCASDGGDGGGDAGDGGADGDAGAGDSNSGDGGDGGDGGGGGADGAATDGSVG